ncbi:hypothetical protein EJ08DRAFT_147296 [Tothia fuscella]|uniref:Uncharacterized protein n=1 Tax=Tothia fuscella TaxID=1048955 RepID=A0A9P4U4V7_9PEZI|nr:hypothetical protein EJ08DRAFT_147296 [Tothia fuscella]
MMYSSPHHSSIPFCDHTIAHHSHQRTFSHSSSLLVTLPHRACYLRESDTPQSHRQRSLGGSPIITPSKIRDYPLRVSSRRQVSQPQAAPLSADTVIHGRKKRITSDRHGVASSNGIFQFVLSSTPPPQTPIVEDSLPRQPPSIKECPDLIDSFIGQSPLLHGTPCPVERRSLVIPNNEKTQHVQHRKAQSLPQGTFAAPIPYSRSKCHPSTDTNICLGGDVKRLTDIPELQRSPSILVTSQNSAQPRPKARRPSVPLRLFPPSPTSSVGSTKSGYADTLSPTMSVFQPSLNLQHQISVFEDDDEKMGLMDYFRWPLHGGNRKKRRNRKKHGCNWKKVFCWK